MIQRTPGNGFAWNKACVCGHVLGDVDCSGSVLAIDALKILRFLAGLSLAQSEPCADIGT